MIAVGIALSAFVSLAAPASGAQQYAPATVSIAQLFERNDRALGTYAPGAYHMLTRSVPLRGDVSTSETYWQGDDDYRTTVRVGGFAWSDGEYRGREWHADSNGVVLPSTNFEEENDPFAAAFQHADRPTSGVTLLGVTPGASPAFVVVVTPNRGLRERRYYDAQTYLLTRVETTDYDGHQRILEFRDYRAAFGRTLPHRIDEESDGLVTLRTTVELVERVDAAHLDLSIPASKPLFDLSGRDSVVIPARFTDEGIVVPVSIGGRGLDFLLDSGDSDLLIDPGIARELGMTPMGAVRMSFAGDFILANARAADLSIGELRAKNVALSTANFSEWLWWHPDHRVVGLLGGDLIAAGALEVDFEKKVVTLFRVLPPDLVAQGWSALPLRLDYGTPLISATFSGRPGHFIADLGAVYSTLYPHYFDAFRINVPHGTPDQGELITIGGRPFGIRHFTMNRLVLGDWIFGDVQVVVPTVDYAQERDYDGLIGRDTLSTFNLIFDYKDGELWFKPIDFGKT
ncbi:MAG TPA: aspartyl protease family protein [Candidatus Cybelea sp.]|nr:aspartyl protease family protein [Candidatus Cybelea sp.]